VTIDKVFYNKSSADSLDWDPMWFGVLHHDEDLVKAVRAWQKKAGLTADGLCGPGTYRRIWTERESSISSYINRCPPEKDQSFIVCNSDLVEINWPRVVLWDEQDGFKSKSGTYYNYSGKANRKPTMFVNHWDVCLSSESCANVLNKRGISVHFLIDNDGTIYQMLDTQHGAWHAGTVNNCSIGVEISSAYSLKYQDWYIKNGFGERPVIEDAICHGKKMKPFLGFYDVQIEALKALWMACHKAYDIPLVAPESGDLDFMTSTKEDSLTRSGKFKGYVSHYHQTRKKIDCAGLDIVKLLKTV
tara:strand:- start:18282 stop:19187 length:906 start_codon:yes stop_codon:yes gene_type:complete